MADNDLTVQPPADLAQVFLFDLQQVPLHNTDHLLDIDLFAAKVWIFEFCENFDQRFGLRIECGFSVALLLADDAYWFLRNQRIRQHKQVGL